MADPQPAPGKRQNKQRRQTAASETHGWEPRRAESRHSLPHPARHPDIQRPDRRRSTKYSSKDPRASADFLDTRSMPTPMRRQLLARPATPKARGRQAYDEDSDDEDDDDSQRGRLRGRMRSRSRVTWGVNSRATSRAKSKMKSRPTSQASESSDSATFATPTRSSPDPSPKKGSYPR
ncbi:hypothetical protein F4777DRAFT_243192 [Nemania sp. FL0916]|nr:hypothetical protein F4777DRAFT_243192 [Nemania sp. FL0916]